MSLASGAPCCPIKSRSSSRRDSRLSFYANTLAIYPETEAARPTRTSRWTRAIFPGLNLNLYSLNFVYVRRLVSSFPTASFPLPPPNARNCRALECETGVYAYQKMIISSWWGDRSKRDPCLDARLDLDGQILVVDQKGEHWVKFDVQGGSGDGGVSSRLRTPRAHGLRYSLTLHGKNNERLVGFDNAHQVRRAAGPGGR